MALNESASFVVALLLAVLTFSSMQILRPHLVATKAMTIVAGFLGSIVFVFLLTALANLEKVVFGRGFSTKWFEVVLCLLVSIAAAGSVHKVSATTAALFSACMLYYLNKLSQETHGSGVAGGLAHVGHHPHQQQGLEKPGKKKK